MRLKNNKLKHFYLSESARVHRPETAVSIMLSKPQRMTPLTKIQRCSKWFSVIRYFPIEAVYFFLNLLDGVKTWQYSQPFLSETWVKRKKQCGRTCISWQNAARIECFLYLKLCCHLIKHEEAEGRDCSQKHLDMPCNGSFSDLCNLSVNPKMNMLFQTYMTFLLKH